MKRTIVIIGSISLFLLLCLLIIDFIAKDSNRPNPSLLRQALDGDIISQTRIGEQYYQAYDYKRALKWLLPAAKQGSSNAQFRLGYMYSEGRGVPQNYKEGFNWYMRAAKQGSSSSQGNIGHMYLKGEGVAQNYKEAFNWFMIAAMQDNGNTQAMLSDMYSEGKGVAQNYVEAHRWGNLAARHQEASSYRRNARDSLAEKMTDKQIEQAQDLARDWRPKTWEEVKEEITSGKLPVQTWSAPIPAPYPGPMTKEEFLNGI